MSKKYPWETLDVNAPSWPQPPDPAAGHSWTSVRTPNTEVGIPVQGASSGRQSSGGFSDLNEELVRLSDVQADAMHYEYDDEGDVSSESATLDWDYVHPNAIAGAAIRNSQEDLTDALRWVLQDTKKQDTAHYWQGAAKLGIDLHALGVHSGERITEAPSPSKLGKLWHTLGIHNVTQNADESVEEFQIRMNDPSNFDSMKGDSISAKAGFEQEFSFPSKSGKGRVGAMEAMRNIAKGYVDAGNFLGEGGNAKYELAVDNMTNKVAKHLPAALREQSMYFANKLSSGEKLEFGDSYAAVLKNLPVGADFASKRYGDTSDLGHNLKGIGEVFGAIHAPVDVERHDLQGIAGWKESAFNYEAANLRDDLARSGDEGKYAEVAEELGATMDTTFNPMYGSNELAPRGVDLQEEIHKDPNAGLTPQNNTTIRIASGTQKVKSRRAAAMAAAKADEEASATRRKEVHEIRKAEAAERAEIMAAPDIIEGMPTSIPDQHYREGDENLIVSNHPQGTPEWHAARNTLLTAADAGLVNGGKYSEEGLRRKLAAASGDAGMSESMYNNNFARGHAIEPQNRAWYEKQFGTPVTEMGLIENPKYPGLGVSVDGLVGTDGLFEAKAPAFKFSQVSEGHAYYDQVQMQMAVTGRDWADISQAKHKQGYVPKGEDPLEYDVVRHKRNDAYIEKQLPKWNKLARQVRIASKTASDADLAADAFEHRPKQQEDDFEARLAKFHAANEKGNADVFEERLKERLENRSGTLLPDQPSLTVTTDKAGNETLSFKDAVRDGVVEADEEITRRKSGGAAGGSGGSGGDGGDGGSSGHFDGVGRGALNFLSNTLGQVGRGDFLGAAGSALKGVPVIGGALAGGIEMMQGLLDRVTDEASNVGDAKVLGVDFNSLNNTQRQGLAFGIDRGQANNLIQTTVSASQGMSVGNADEASKMVVATRGFISFADLQQYGDDPLTLGARAMGKMKRAGLSDGQISSLMRSAGLGDALKMRGSTERQVEIAGENTTEISTETQESISTIGAEAGARAIAKQDFIQQGAEGAGTALRGSVDLAVSTIKTVEAGAEGAMKLVANSTELMSKLMQGIAPDLADIKTMIAEKLGIQTPARGEDGKRTDGKTPVRVGKDGERVRETSDNDLPSNSKELLEEGESFVVQTAGYDGKDWPAYNKDAANSGLNIKRQKPMSAKERADPDWAGGLADLEALAKSPINEYDRKEIDKAITIMKGRLGKGADKQSSQIMTAKPAENVTRVVVSVDEFNVKVTAQDDKGNQSQASRKGQLRATTF